MAINLQNIVVPGGAGVVDEVMERWDKKRGRTKSFQNATDIARAAGVGVGYGLQLFMPRYSSIGATLAASFTPLLVKTLAKVIIRVGTVKPAFSPADFTPRLRASPSRSQQPEFAEGRIL